MNHYNELKCCIDIVNHEGKEGHIYNTDKPNILVVLVNDKVSGIVEKKVTQITKCNVYGQQTYYVTLEIDGKSPTQPLRGCRSKKAVMQNIISTTGRPTII